MRIRGICSVEGCGRPHAAKGLCQKHHWRMRHNGESVEERHKYPAGVGLTIDILREFLSYDKDSGEFTWIKISTNGRSRPGDIAGTLGTHGYIAISLLRNHYLAHRLAWFFHYGYWPEKQIDHINGIRTDNRIENLRHADYSLNAQNARASRRNSSTGFLGVFPWGRGKRFLARICVDRKQIKIGVYDTPEEAHQAYLAAKRKLHPGCTI